MKILQPQDKPQWDALIEHLPGAHALQTKAWGQVKARFGWTPHYLLWQEDPVVAKAAALLLQRDIKLGGMPLPWRVMYIPRGPLLDWSDSALVQIVLNDL